MSMATAAFDNFTHELEGKFGVGQAAQPLMRELLQLMTGSGGVAGFIDRFRSAGLGREVSSFVGGQSAAALSPKNVDAALGESTVAGIAQRVGLKPAVASTALGFEIPKVIGLLTPGGKVPNALPSEFQSILRSTDQVEPEAITTIRGEEKVRPEAMATIHTARPVEPVSRGSNVWLWPLLGLLALGALLYWAFLPRRISPPVLPRIASVDILNRTLSSTVLNFAPRSAVLPPTSAPALQQAAIEIKNMPANTTIEIAGHTDNVGDAAANMILSQRRAEAVRNALVQDGVDPARLVAKGYGETRPIASNDTAEGRLRNRRIEFTSTSVSIPR